MSFLEGIFLLEVFAREVFPDRSHLWFEPSLRACGVSGAISL